MSSNVFVTEREIDWIHDKIEKDRRELESCWSRVARMANIDTTLRKGMPMLWGELVDRIERDIGNWNEGYKLHQRERQAFLEKPSDDSLRIIGKTYGQVCVGGGFEEASRPFYLHIYLRAGDKEVEYRAEPKICQGSLSIDVGSGGSPAFFENGRQVSLERASQAILEKFLDLTGKPAR